MNFCHTATLDLNLSSSIACFSCTSIPVSTISLFKHLTIFYVSCALALKLGDGRPFSGKRLLAHTFQRCQSLLTNCTTADLKVSVILYVDYITFLDNGIVARLSQLRKFDVHKSTRLIIRISLFHVTDPKLFLPFNQDLGSLTSSLAFLVPFEIILSSHALVRPL